MQSHCLVVAGNFCEAPTSGPVLACLADLADEMDAYTSKALPQLPERIDATGLRQRSYIRAITRASDPSESVRRCNANHSVAYGQAICRATASFGRMTDVLHAARLAGITLP